MVLPVAIVPTARHAHNAIDAIALLVSSFILFTFQNLFIILPHPSLCQPSEKPF